MLQVLSQMYYYTVIDMHYKHVLKTLNKYEEERHKLAIILP